MRKRIVLGLLGFAGVMMAAAPASAVITDNFTFDPDGVGGDAAIANVKTFDWNVDNALSVGSSVAIQNFISGVGPTTFNTYYHARLSALNNVGGTNVTPADFPPKEITIVAGFQEQVVAVTPVFGGTQVQFITTGVAAGGGAPDAIGAVAANFAEIYYQAAGNASPLAGTGYRDGTLILAATVNGFGPGLDGLTQFTRNLATTPLGGPYVDLDDNGSDDYDGAPFRNVDSIVGGGDTKLTANVFFQDNAFFIDSLVLFSLFNTTNTLNFTQVDPSHQFDAQAGILLFDVGYNLGDVNGAIAALGDAPFGTGNSLQFQADGNQTFLVEQVIPEPVTAGLGIIGLVGLGLATLRRRRP